MNELSTTQTGLADDSIESEMFANYREAVDRYREENGVSTQEAIATVDQSLADGPLSTQCRPDQLTWLGLHVLANRDPKLAAQRWEEVKRSARKELTSGHRAAKTLEARSTRPFDRAQFLALRDELAGDWQPRNGIERTLIDTMAQAHTSYLHWLERLTALSTLPDIDNRATKERGTRKKLRVTDAEAIDQASMMVDRFNRLFVRSLRALRDLRRYTTNIVVQNASQVNVGEQQVNVADS